MNPNPINVPVARRAKPLRLELIESGTTNTTSVTETDYSPAVPEVEKTVTRTGIIFKTGTGSFELTHQAHPIGITLALANRRDKSRLTATLVTHPSHLNELRGLINLKKAQRSPFAKVSQTSVQVPCLIIKWKEATGSFAQPNREIPTGILTAAAFGLLKFSSQIAGRQISPAVCLRPDALASFINFTTGQLPPPAAPDFVQ